MHKKLRWEWISLPRTQIDLSFFFFFWFVKSILGRVFSLNILGRVSQQGPSLYTFITIIYSIIPTLKKNLTLETGRS